MLNVGADLNPEADLMDEDVQPPCTEKSDRPAWIPIDRSNEAFLIELEQRKQTKQQDFRKANMVCKHHNGCIITFYFFLINHSVDLSSIV